MCCTDVYLFTTNFPASFGHTNIPGGKKLIANEGYYSMCMGSYKFTNFKILNCKNLCRILADVYKITVGLSKMYNDEIKIFKISYEITK